MPNAYPISRCNIQIRQEGARYPHLVLKSFAEKLDTFNAEESTTIKDNILNDVRRYINSNRKRPKSVRDPQMDVYDSHPFRRTTALENIYNTLLASTNISTNRNGRCKLNIGEKSFLDAHAPYWYKVSYGGKIKMNMSKNRPGVPGYFYRNAFFPTPSVLANNPHKWVLHRNGTSSNASSFLPAEAIKNPIPPMRYLNRMAEVFVRQVEEYKRNLNNFTRKNLVYSQRLSTGQLILRSAETGRFTSVP